MSRKYLGELTIDRAKWGTNALLNQDDTMCCLGFACRAAGIGKSKIGNQGMPGDVFEELPNKRAPSRLNKAIKKWAPFAAMITTKKRIGDDYN